MKTIFNNKAIQRQKPKWLILISIPFAITCCNVNANPSFKIGDIATSKLTGGCMGENSAIRTSASGFLHSCCVIDNNCTYEIGIDEDRHIQFIQTDDTKFKTPEGLMIGKSTFKDALNHTDFGLIHEGGFALYVPLKSGWNAVLDNPTSFWFIEVPFDKKIIYFFKRQ